MIALNDTVRLSHNVRIDVCDGRTGARLRRITCKNLVVNTGLGQLIDLGIGNSTKTFSYAATGTGATAPAAGQTTLVTEVFRNQITSNSRVGNVWTVTLFLSTTQANGNTLQEFGEFTASLGGLMLARATHAPIVKTSSITVLYTHVITLSAS